MIRIARALKISGNRGPSRTRELAAGNGVRRNNAFAAAGGDLPKGNSLPKFREASLHTARGWLAGRIVGGSTKRHCPSPR